MHANVSQIADFHAQHQAAVSAFTPRTLVLPERKVLLCDDAPEARLMLRKILQHAGFTVLEADTGAEALRALREDSGIELLLLDLIIPDMNGFSVLEELAALPHRPRVCVTSALTDRATVDKALALNADDYLVKPIFPREILYKAKSLLGTLDEDDDDRRPVHFDAIIKAGRFSRTATVSWLSANSIELCLEDTAGSLPEHVRLMCPALWRSLDHFQDILGGMQLRVGDVVREPTKVRVRADFVGLTEPIRQKLRQLLKNRSVLNTPNLLH